MEKEKRISDRITLVEDKNSLILMISGKIEKWKETMLFVWLLGWLFCGGVFVYELFKEHTQDICIALIVYLCFWAYFAYKIGYAFLWRKWGQELIKINENSMLIKREIGTYGKVYVYQKDNIKNLEGYAYSEKSLSKVFSDSFWVVGGEKIIFDHFNSKVGFGLQLTRDEQKKLLTLIKKNFQ